MTSMLPEETKMKGKLNDVHGKEEARSFLSFSRENLSISQSELEQGFNKYRFRPTRNTVLSIAALSIALLCLGLESWKFHWSTVNAREIKELKRSVENLKNRFLEKDLLDKLNAEESEDYVEAEIGNADYDSNYDEDLSTHDYSMDYHTAPTFGARPSDFPDSSSTIAPVPSPPEATFNKAVMKLLKFEIKQDSKKNSRESHRKDRHQEDRKVLEKKLEDQKNSTKEKRDVERVKRFLDDWKASLKRKRSTEEQDASRELTINRNRTSNFHEKSRDKTGSGKDSTLTESSKRHTPKKYYTRSQDAFSLRMKNNSITHQPKRSSRRLRKSLSEPRQIFAVHYGGDRHGFTSKDQHTGNGRIRHAGKVFTSWKPNDWVQDLGMDEHFRLMKNGSVVVYKSGLYLAYAQIHYKDDHEEVGFHLVVNDEPILQCVIDNSGRSRMNSQSCFSAQVTRLNRDDVVVLQEIGSPKYALFNAENSFFGLVKLGEFHNLKRSV
ncbi:TNF superfamily member 12 eiger isoform X2 [Megachile rotundata]|uniref:TNF superfamily member 12 eiger isoform X2 n=1 Tax=Megachile rotundata TaxID=143995 RepID=UPI0006154226|nr:PREDICTED: uncharacterized protein LOC100877826 isoform X2 [Megachile rotundata]